MNNKKKHRMAEQVRKRLLGILQDSKQASDTISGFFQDVGCDYITLKIINKKSVRGFDSDAFLEKLRNTTMDEYIEEEEWWDSGEDFDEFFENNSPKIEKGIPIPDDDPAGDWLRDTLETEHHKNRSKRFKKKFQDAMKGLDNDSHPMERFSDGSKDDRVGVFAIAYVEYLEKQNDLLRKNNIKGGKDVKKNTRKND